MEANSEKTVRYDKAKQCLIDNGIEEGEAAVVLQALVYILNDEEIDDYVDDRFYDRGKTEEDGYGA